MYLLLDHSSLCCREIFIPLFVAQRHWTLFIIAHIINSAYCDSHTTTNIMSGFVKSRVWDWEHSIASIEPLRNLPLYNEGANYRDDVTEEFLSFFDEVVDIYERRSRYLLQDVDVATIGTVRINTRRGAHFTGYPVLDALQRNEEARNSDRASATSGAEEARKRAEDVEHMRLYAPVRRITLARLYRTRIVRRVIAATRAS